MGYYRVLITSSAGSDTSSEAYLSIISADWMTKFFGPGYLTDPWAAPDADCDGDGVSNLQEYGSQTDPNKIDFTVVYASDHVKNALVSGAIQSVKGEPVYMAVLLDDTPLTSGSWVAYSPAFTVTLPSQGRHKVNLGLRGFADTGCQSWDTAVITLDTTAPLLVITNPVATTTSVPLLQLQGYSPEPLDSITYDLQNSSGLVTGQPCLIVKQWYDTNVWDITTNFFQCFDISLALGDNTITLHATDLAGNTATLVRTYTLLSDTTPPLVTLGWPLPGATVAASTITLDGWVNDPAATVALSWVDSSGAANSLGAEIERDGHFWVDELPPAGGANNLTISATDAWGNTSVTNFVVNKGTLELTIDQPGDDQLLAPTTDVSGQVGNDSYVVKVNGVTAQVSAGGSWVAHDVPVNPGTTVMFTASAYPTGHPELATEARNDSVLPSRLYVEQSSDHVTKVDNDDAKRYDSAVATDPVSCHQSQQSVAFGHDWFHAKTGQGKWHEDYAHTDICGGTPTTDTCETTMQWPASEKSDWNLITSDNNCIARTPSIGSFDWQRGTIDCNYRLAPGRLAPVFWWPGADVRWVDEVTSGTYSRQTMTRLTIYTGGRATVSRQNLFEVSASATELVFRRDHPEILAENAVPPGEIRVGDFGVLGNDGKVWSVKPDGATLDATPKTTRKFYGFSINGVKHVLVSQTHALAPPDRARTCLGVGEEVDLSFVPPITENATWTASAGGVVPQLGTATLFTAPSNAATLNISCQVRTATIRLFYGVYEPMSLRFSNKQHGFCCIPSPPSLDFYTVDYDADVYVGPDTVNFYRVELADSSAPTQKTGYFLDKNIDDHKANSGHKMDGSVVPGKGSHMSVPDGIGGSASPGPYRSGTWSWHILWSWQIPPLSLRPLQYVDEAGDLNVQGVDGSYAVRKGASGYLIRSPSGQVEEAQ